MIPRGTLETKISANGKPMATKKAKYILLLLVVKIWMMDTSNQKSNNSKRYSVNGERTKILSTS